jgi:hypothetical protein
VLIHDVTDNLLDQVFDRAEAVGTAMWRACIRMRRSLAGMEDGTKRTSRTIPAAFTDVERSVAVSDNGTTAGCFADFRRDALVPFAAIQPSRSLMWTMPVMSSRVS